MNPHVGHRFPALALALVLLCSVTTPGQRRSSRKRQPNSRSSAEAQRSPPGGQAKKNTGTVIEITPLRNEWGIVYGAEARDAASRALLATAEQVAMKDDLLVVEEVHYSAGAVVYKGRLFFAPGGELVKQVRIRGNKKWEVFQNWSW